MKKHRGLSQKDFADLVTSLIQGKSSTEKTLAGILLDYSTTGQRGFDPNLFDAWLDQLEGWAEIDTLCTGDYSATRIPEQWTEWKKILIQFSKSKNITKR